MCLPDEIELPANFAARRIPPTLRWVYAQVRAKAGPMNSAAMRVTEPEARETAAVTLGMIAMIKDADGEFFVAQEAMRLRGVTPAEVGMVPCPHLHLDHTVWMTRSAKVRWQPTFPGRRHPISDAGIDI